MARPKKMQRLDSLMATIDTNITNNNNNNGNIDSNMSITDYLVERNLSINHYLNDNIFREIFSNFNVAKLTKMTVVSKTWKTLCTDAIDNKCKQGKNII